VTVASTRPAALDILIDGRAIETGDPREVRRALLATAAAPFAEIWLSVNGGAAMALLKSGERALCLFVRHHGDSGFTSRSPPREPVAEGEVEFRLGKSDKGERTKFPRGWTVPLFVALRAADEFLRTGERPPQILWHDDQEPQDPPPPASTSARKPRASAKSAPRKRST
jgi:hypothetical protein